VVVTAGEVDAARLGPEKTDLYLLHGIVVMESEDGVVATGGVKRSPWRPEASDLQPIEFRYSLPVEIDRA
jgi:hypothetical protein